LISRVILPFVKIDFTLSALSAALFGIGSAVAASGSVKSHAAEQVSYSKQAQQEVTSRREMTDFSGDTVETQDIPMEKGFEIEEFEIEKPDILENLGEAIKIMGSAIKRAKESNGVKKYVPNMTHERFCQIHNYQPEGCQKYLPSFLFQSLFFVKFF